ncbi:hypothetical protein [Streptomyces cucumeris]|uniref:hypothetical protein n=1 Tax=Streptomyces cucumeris TaxID=2962890 RepID=UPI0020C91597|nr:hypothetical protein [Streptomyces sp. NEAU-Y11]MCP9205530.1 hypothetical protein [Streptomyces sp. NEAU-Y11]
MITATRTAAQNLQTIIDRWSDLTDALTARQQATWPPTMGVARLVTDLEANEHTHPQRIVTRRDEHGRPTYECASCDHVGDGNGHPIRPDRDQPGPGASPAPISVDILDTMRSVEAELVHCADVIASQIQRPAMNHAPRGAGWTEAEIAQRDQLADQDAADPRRWRYPGTRTAVYAAAWLAARLESVPGPFLPLGPLRGARIATVAAQAATRVEAALRIARQAVAVDWPCPACRGLLEVHGGDGQPPAIQCADCGRTWHEQETNAA